MKNYEQKLCPNTKECAYDGFGNELHVGDIVAFAASRWTGDYIMYTGIVRGWSEKMLRIEGISGATNSDKPAGMEYAPIIGRVSNRKPDKCLKISGGTDTLDEGFTKFKEKDKYRGYIVEDDRDGDSDNFHRNIIKRPDGTVVREGVYDYCLMDIINSLPDLTAEPDKLK